MDTIGKLVKNPKEFVGTVQSHTQQRSLEKYEFDLAIMRLVRELRRGIHDDDGIRLLTRLPTEAERDVLLRRQEYLDRAVAPAKSRECAGEIARLLSGFLSAKAGDTQMTIAQYVHYLHDMPLWAIRGACEPGACRELDGYNPAFAPSAEQLHLVAGRFLDKVLRERVEVVEVLGGKLEEHRHRPTKAEIEAKLGRPLPKQPRPESAFERRERMQRIADDLALRKARNESIASSPSGEHAPSGHYAPIPPTKDRWLT